MTGDIPSGSSRIRTESTQVLVKALQTTFLHNGPEKVVVIEVKFIFRCSQQSRICGHLSFLQPREFLLHVFIIFTSRDKPTYVGFLIPLLSTP